MIVFTSVSLDLKEERAMKRRVSLTGGRKLKWILPLVALVLMAGIAPSQAGAGERLLIPDDIDLPFYAVGLGHNRELTLVATVFYRPLEGAPGGLTVNQFGGFNPADYPLRVEGFAVMNKGVFPMTSTVWNRPGEVVEICFESAEDYVAAMPDGTTIDEIRAMPSLIVGYADFYLDIQHPVDPDAPGKGFSRTVIASGVLENGTPFCVRSVYTAGAYNVEFAFGE